MARTPILIHIYQGNNSLEYSGRLLGAVEDVEFQAIMKENSIAKGLLTQEATSILDLYMDKKELIGKRLVFALKAREAEDVFKTLLVTDRLAKFNYLTPDRGQIAFNFESGNPNDVNWMILYED